MQIMPVILTKLCLNALDGRQDSFFAVRLGKHVKYNGILVQISYMDFWGQRFCCETFFFGGGLGVDCILWRFGCNNS